MGDMHDAEEAARTTLIGDAARIGIRDVSPLVVQDDGRTSLMLTVDVSSDHVPVRLVLPVAFPFGEIEMFVDAQQWPFAHQASSGKICPPPGAIQARNASRLVEGAEAAAKWLRDAHAGTLTAPDERYELPEFPICRSDWLLLFDEEAAEYARWASWMSKSGSVTCSKQGGGWAAERFHAPDGQVIASRATVRSPLDATRLGGRWILVDALSEHVHRVARTWEELRAVVVIPLDDVLFEAWRDSEDDVAIILVGTPMRATWGGVPTRVHWQPIVFPSHRSVAKQARARMGRGGRPWKAKNLAAPSLWKKVSPTLLAGPIPWARAEDVSRDRLYVRSTAVKSAFHAPLLIGCGAIGSAVSDCLVRGGLPRITLLDNDLLEYGNLCRHVLTGAEVPKPKAAALALHLQLASPSVDAKGMRATLPPVTADDSRIFHEAATTADLVIDATGNREVLEWLGALNHKQQVASLWTNADASIGVAVLTGLRDRPTVAELEAHVRSAIHAGDVQDVSADAYEGPEPRVPGAGCWHPTFLGDWSRIVGLGAVFASWLSAAARGGGSGRAVVFRFSEGTWTRARSWSIAAGAGDATTS